MAYHDVCVLHLLRRAKSLWLVRLSSLGCARMSMCLNGSSEVAIWRAPRCAWIQLLVTCHRRIYFCISEQPVGIGSITHTSRPMQLSHSGMRWLFVDNCVRWIPTSDDLQCDRWSWNLENNELLARKKNPQNIKNVIYDKNQQHARGARPAFRFPNNQINISMN